MLKSLIWIMAQCAKRTLLRIKKVVCICKINTLKSKRIIDIDQSSAGNYIRKYRSKNDMHCVPVNRERRIKLSVIIPVYNAEKYIKECINSIVSQDISCTYEIICVDDGSKDASLEILQSMKCDKLRIISQPNAGAGVARNRGLDASLGEYIIFVDSDDSLIDGSINKMLEAAQTEDADIVFGTIAKTKTDMSNAFYPLKRRDRVVDNLLVACSLTTGTPWGKCYKYCLWENIRFPESYAYEDTIIFMNLFAKSKKFVALGTPVYCFRSSNNSLFKRENGSKRSADMAWVVLDALKMHLYDGGVITTRYYELLLWHLSAITFSRIKNLQDETLLENVFAYIAHEVSALFSEHPVALDFEGKNGWIYKKVHQSFIENDYLLYTSCCEALSGLGLI